VVPPATVVPCVLQGGFGQFAAELGADVVGTCAGNERAGPNGLTVEQPTTNGLLAWWKIDNSVAFTNGNTTWLRCFEQIYMRPSQSASRCPTPEYQSSTASGTVLIEDTFDNRDYGWLAEERDSQDYQFRYENGEYVVRKINAQYDKSPSAFLVSTYKDVRISVDARISGDVSNRSIVMGCRRRSSASDGIQYYRLVVRTDIGQYALTKLSGGFAYLKEWTSSPAIARGSEWNHLGLTCDKHSISVTINGQQVASVSDEALSNGQVWIGSGEMQGLSEVRFDNLVVAKP
jgi:hypothetical protein